MRYALLYYETPQEIAKRQDPAAVEAYWAGWTAYMGMIAGLGVMQGGAGLEPPPTGTIVRSGPSGRVVQDGPFAEAREELGGFVIVDVPDLDAALAIAEQAPCAKAGHVEVRPCLLRPAADR